MPTRLDDAQIRVSLVVDGGEGAAAAPTERRAKKKKREERLESFVDRVKKRRRERAKKRQQREDAIRQQRVENRFRLARLPSLAGGAQAIKDVAQIKALGIGAAARAGVGVFAIAKLVEQIVPVIGAAVVEMVNALLDEIGLPTLGDSGVDVLDEIADLVSEKLAQARALFTATGEAISVAEATATEQEFIGAGVDVSQVILKGAQVFEEVFSIESARRQIEAAFGRQIRQDVVRQMVRQALKD